LTTPQATVVVADGSVLTASQTENPDLFFGIRGGGSNFGVCTEFVLKLHPQRRSIFSGIAVFAPDALEKLMSVTEEWWNKGISEKEGIIQTFTRGRDGHVSTAKPFFFVDMADLTLFLASRSSYILLQWHRSRGTGKLQSLL